MKRWSGFNQHGLATPGCLLVLAGCLLLGGCVSNLHLRQQGRNATFAGDLELAHQKFAQAVQREPDDYRAQYYLGVNDLARKQPLEGQWALENALRLRPDDPEWTPQILDQIAEALYQQDQADKLEVFLRTTLGYYGQWNDYLRQAKYLAKIGDMDGAALAHHQAAYFAPAGYTSPYLAMADFYESINNQPKVELALRYAYHVNPKAAKVSQRLRKFGIVPGPTIAVSPPKLAANPEKSQAGVD
jgi:tetratricopeptide (TPR) repeat protein